MLTTSETYPWSLETQIFHNGQPNHGGDRKTFEVMTYRNPWFRSFLVCSSPLSRIGMIWTTSSGISYQLRDTKTCKKYSVTVMFYYIFHIKPHFFKTLFPSQFLFDFDEIFINKSENVSSFCDYFIIFFESIDFKYSRFKHKLKLYVFKSTFIVLSSWLSEFIFVLNMWTLKILRWQNYAEITM